MIRPGPRLPWIALQLALAGAWWLVLPTWLRLLRQPLPTESVRPLAWACVAALLHGLLGMRLLRSGKTESGGDSNGIRGGLKVLALRYFAGVGLVLAGLLNFPSQKTVFVAAWSGLFLILTVTEMIVFFKGVNRL